MSFACIFSPPGSRLDAVHTCVTRLYSSSTISVVQLGCLSLAWDQVQIGKLSLKHACTTVITSQNCSHFLDEWCVAHNLLMQAVTSGDIPPSCDFDGKQLHWHQVFYTHCSKLPIGEKDITIGDGGTSTSSSKITDQPTTTENQTVPEFRSYSTDTVVENLIVEL